MSEEIAVAEVTTAAPVIETPAPAVETPSEPRSLDDTLAATMAEIQARRPTQGEDGKFIAKVGAETATPELKPPGQSQTGAPEPAPPAIEAPQSAPADVKELWATVPPKAQAWIAARETESHKKITADGERLKSLAPIEEALAPFQERLKQVNAPPAEYIRRLGTADHLLSTDFDQGIREIYRLYGRDPRAAQQTTGQPVDPQFNALAQELGAIKSHLTAQEKAAETARLTEAGKKIEAFKAKAPHFDKVEALMTKLYEPGMELETLYDMATKAHPEVSKTLEAERETKAKADALEKQKAEAAAAAKLVTLSKKPGSVGVVAKTGGSWEDTMAATHRGIRARG